MDLGHQDEGNAGNQQYKKAFWKCFSIWFGLQFCFFWLLNTTGAFNFNDLRTLWPKDTYQKSERETNQVFKFETEPKAPTNRMNRNRNETELQEK